MSHAGHFVRRCECGIVLAQCRCCFGPDRAVEVVSPCTHSKVVDLMEALEASLANEAREARAEHDAEQARTVEYERIITEALDEGENGQYGS